MSWELNFYFRFLHDGHVSTAPGQGTFTIYYFNLLYNADLKYMKYTLSYDGTPRRRTAAANNSLMFSWTKRSNNNYWRINYSKTQCRDKNGMSGMPF